MNIQYGVEHLDAEGLLPVLTGGAMRAADAVAIDDMAIASATLMETAGRACAATAAAMLSASGGERATVLCGKGNNGGDGYVVARQLLIRGFRVRVVSIAEPASMSPDTRHQFRLLERLALDFDEEYLTLERYDPSESYPPADLWVDALLGTGLASDIREPYRSIINGLSRAGGPVLAVDIPSGLDADTGRALGVTVAADVTVTMGAVKAGMVLGDGPSYCGRVEVAEIGIPPGALSSRAVARLTTDLAVTEWIPIRPRDAHKYSAGMVLVIGGSQGMAGAPAMTAMAAARGGAGYVSLACPEGIRDVLAGKLTSITLGALPSAADGGIDASGAFEVLAERLNRASAVAIGPGLGRKDSTVRFVNELLATLDKPVVVDADALFALSSEPAILEMHGRPEWILTPHEGEFRRLASDDVKGAHRFDVAKRYAATWNCTLLLKGTPSIVAAPDGAVPVASPGSNALATAGTGDILAGFCAALLARGLSPSRAAAAALHIGGAAAEVYGSQRAPETMLATDLLRHVPRLLKTRFRK